MQARSVIELNHSYEKRTIFGIVSKDHENIWYKSKVIQLKLLRKRIDFTEHYDVVAQVDIDVAPYVGQKKP